MTLDKDDKKEMRSMMVKVVGDALEQIVLPEFQRVRDDLKDHKEENQKKFKKVNDKLEDIEDSSNRVETLVKSEIKYVDELSDRVLVLEKAHK